MKTRKWTQSWCKQGSTYRETVTLFSCGRRRKLVSLTPTGQEIVLEFATNKAALNFIAAAGDTPNALYNAVIQEYEARLAL